MPSLNDSPDFAMLVEVDRRSDVGVTIFDRGGAGTVLSTQGFFDDELSELNGKGRLSGHDLQSRLDAQFGVGNVLVSLNAQDRFELTTGGAPTIAIGASSDNAVFGFDVAGHVAAARERLQRPAQHHIQRRPGDQRRPGYPVCLPLAHLHASGARDHRRR